MNLVEVLVASAMFVTSSSCSLQLWSSGASWTRQAEAKQQQQAELEAALLASQAQLTALAGTPIATDGRHFSLTLRPFEIATLRLRPQ